MEDDDSFIKIEEDEIISKDNTIKNIIQNNIKNMYYNWSYSINNINISINDVNLKKVYLIGRVDKQKDPFNYFFYFNYKKNIIYNKFDTDSGWGCIIRVGQMILSHIFYKLLINKNDNCSIEDIRNKIKKNFIDDENSYFSFQKIWKVGSKKLNFKVKEWWKSLSFIIVIKTLNNLVNDNNLVQYKNNEDIYYFDDSNLKIICNKYGLINFYKITKHMFMNEIKNNEDNILIYNENKNKNEVLIEKFKYLGQKPKNLVYYVEYIIGKDISITCFEIIKSLISFKFTCGIFGSMKSSSLFIIGFEEENFLYLDPHLVTDSINLKNFEEKKKEIDIKTIKKTNYKNFNPVFGFLFLLKDLNDINNFKKYLYKLKKKYNEEFFISISNN